MERENKGLNIGVRSFVTAIVIILDVSTAFLLERIFRYFRRINGLRKIIVLLFLFVDSLLFDVNIGLIFCP